MYRLSRPSPESRALIERVGRSFPARADAFPTSEGATDVVRKILDPRYAKRTLAGRVAKYVYKFLAERPGATLPALKVEKRLLGKSVKAFRKAAKASGLGFRDGPHPTERSFHLNLEGGRTSSWDHEYTRGFPFFFGAKRTPKGRLARAYVTLSPEAALKSGEHFVNLAKALADAGVPFEAKGMSPAYALGRYDPLVFYVPQALRDAAGKALEAHLEKTGIGGGFHPAAFEGRVNGLSWALEPTVQEAKLAARITGQSEKGINHSRLVALLSAPIVLRRLAEAHRAKGNPEVARKFAAEAKRVEQLVADFQKKGGANS